MHVQTEHTKPTNHTSLSNLMSVSLRAVINLISQAAVITQMRLPSSELYFSLGMRPEASDTLIYKYSVKERVGYDVAPSDNFITYNLGIIDVGLRVVQVRPMTAYN